MHENKNNRWGKWNYSWNGFYFITICTKDRYPYFGFIENGEMNFNDVGGIVNNCLLEIEKHFKFIKLDEYCVMPNHIHCIIEINNVGFNLDDDIGNDDVNDVNCVNDLIDVGVAHVRHLRHDGRDYDRSKMYLSKIVHGFKSSSTKHINRIKPYFFKWQRSFHDHIIRNEKEYLIIKNYIKNNPKIWYRDRNNIDYLK